MFHNKSSTMAQRSRIPVRRAAAAINDENKVGAPADPHGTGAAAPIKAVGAVRPVAPAGAGSRLAAKPITAGPAKAFGAPVAGATNAVSRGVLCDVGRLRAPGIVSRLAKPSEVADRLPIKTARVASSGIVKPAVLGQRVRQPVAAAVAVAARPTISAVRAPVLSARPISRPGASFGMRRARQPDAPPAPVAAPVPVAEPVGAALAKRVRTASASNVIPQPTAGAAAATSLGKHTRSGHVTRSVSSDPVLPAVGGLRLAAAPTAAAESGCESADDLASTAVASSAASLNLGSLQSSPDAGNLGDLKFVDVDTIDYALVHTGLENEVPITLSEINVFEADVDPTDPAMLSEFSDDIFGYMRELEVKLMPDPRYIAGQPALSWSTRAVLVEWLVQVHLRLNLLPETLYLCVNFVDRFLSLKAIPTNKLQLVGAVCLLLAAKYEELYVPSVNDMVYIVEKSYGASEILRAERVILKVLNFDLGWPGPLSFLRRISKADEYDMATRTLAKYLMEVTLIDERFIGVPSSKLAATAHYVSLRLLGNHSWSRAHAFYSGYFESELMETAMWLVEQLMQPRKHRAIFEKYSSRHFLRASEYVYGWLKSFRPETLLNAEGVDLRPAAAVAKHSSLPVGAEAPIY